MRHYRTGTYIPLRRRTPAVREAQEIASYGIDPDSFLAWAAGHAAEELEEARKFRELNRSWIRHRQLIDRFKLETMPPPAGQQRQREPHESRLWERL